MKIRRIVAETLPAAVAVVRREMGRDAVIFDTRRVPAGGWRRLFRRYDRVEVSAAVEGWAAGARSGAAPARAPEREGAGAPAPGAAAPAGPLPWPAPPAPAPPAVPVPGPAPRTAAPGPGTEQPGGDAAGRPLALDLRELGSPDVLRQALFADGLAPLGTGAPSPIRVQPGLRRLIALVGPTGAGKTTTLAKLAAHLHLQQGWRVGLITADTFRVGAVEQLQAYARLLGLRCEVTPTPGALARALERMQDADAVLIDTSGRGHHDGRRMQELTAFLRAAREVAGDDAAGGLEVHLVLAASTRRAEVDAILAAYRPCADRLLLTKLDECETAPEALAAAAAQGLPLSYCSAGQRVPDDLALAWPDRLADGLAGRAAAGGTPQVQLRTG